MRVVASASLLRFGHVTTIGEVAPAFGDPIPDDVMDDLDKVMPLMVIDCIDLGLPFSMKAARRMHESIQKDGYDTATFCEDARDLRRRLWEELESRLFCLIPPERATFYENQAEWSDVLDSFPSALMDADEIGKCYALGRYTASVFHAMRVLEIGLVAMAKAVGIAAGKENWQNVIDQIEAEIQKRSKGQGGHWPDRQFFSEAALQFRYFKDAWRNHVMHVRLTFDQERAYSIQNHTREFMRDLATRLKE